MNMFNKIVKKQGGAISIDIREAEQKKIQERINFIIQGINTLFEQNNVSIFEAIDALNSVKLNVDIQLSKLVNARDLEISQLKNDLAKSKTSGGKEDSK